MRIDPGIIDAAKRASDAINKAIVENGFDMVTHKWLAIRLSDGGTDGVLYDTKRDAVRRQSNEFQCAYVALRNLRQGAKPEEMARFLQFNRDAYDAGFRLPDPDSNDGGPELLRDAATNDFYREMMRDVETLIRAERLHNGY